MAHLQNRTSRNTTQVLQKSQFPLARKKNKKVIHFQKSVLYLSNNDKSKLTSQMKASFGEYIRKLRTENGMTLTQLAAQLELDSANLSKIENGKREFDEKRLEKLATVFSLKLDDIKTEFFSDLFAKKIYENNCSMETLMVAEEKVNYLKSKNVKQGEIKFNTNE
ncbi:MAG: helix-turn-helix transcriptional regulator [Chitinophagales bacterium]|nr:helix-turn-helix transcriptional regulator [Chitinophagales bacterium]